MVKSSHGNDNISFLVFGGFLRPDVGAGTIGAFIISFMRTCSESD